MRRSRRSRRGHRRSGRSGRSWAGSIRHRRAAGGTSGGMLAAMDEAGLRAELQRLAADHERTRRGVAELQQQFETLIEIMIAFGTLRPGHAQLIAKLRQRVEIARKAPVELSSVEDKYAVTGEPIDC